MTQVMQMSYQELIDSAVKKAEVKFDATIVEVQKNVLLLRRKSSPVSDKPFLTIKANLAGSGFYEGDYDMDFDAAVWNFNRRGCLQHRAR